MLIVTQKIKNVSQIALAKSMMNFFRSNYCTVTAQKTLCRFCANSIIDCFLSALISYYFWQSLTTRLATNKYFQPSNYDGAHSSLFLIDDDIVFALLLWLPRCGVPQACANTVNDDNHRHHLHNYRWRFNYHLHFFHSTPC